MTDPACVLIADDHPLFREALRHVVDRTLHHAEIREARSYVEILELVGAARRFDLVFVDLIMPGAGDEFEELADLRARLGEETKLIVVSSREEWPTIRRVMELGAAAFIPKSASRAEMERAIRRVLAGQNYQPDAAHGRAVRRAPGAEAATLTPRQAAVLEQLARGSSNRQIARELHIEEITVKAHISAILRKLHVKNRLEAVVVSKTLVDRDHSAS
jgi:DNA-binding NarL/FixJ family response regulator